MVLNREAIYPERSRRVLRLSCSLFTLLLFLVGCVPRAHAQFVGFVSPQTDQEVAFNNTTCASGTFTPHNLGQTVHFVSYTTTGAIGNLDLRLEASNDGTTFFPISDEATDPGSGSIYADGYYPVVRVRIVTCQGGGLITASYVGTSSSPTPPLGTYNAAQAFRKVIGTFAPAGTNLNVTINTPFGSSLGYLVFTNVAGPANFPAGSTISISTVIGNVGLNNVPLQPSGNMTTGPLQVFVAAGTEASEIQLTYTAGGASTSNFSAYYVFVNPGSPSGISTANLQPLQTFNSETTATAAAATKTIAGAAGLRITIFSVSARCSAGTAGLTVADGATTIWSSGTTEIATTTFRFQWSPGLAATLGNGTTITLTSCGVGNTGTLDVQASQQ